MVLGKEPTPAYRGSAYSRSRQVVRILGAILDSSGAAHICRLNAKPLQAVSLWLREYELFWGESLRGLKNYVERTANQKETDL